MTDRFNKKVRGGILALAAAGIAVTLVLVGAFNAHAEDEIQSCDELQMSAKHQLERDAPLQSALWRRYDHMLRNLMLPMNARLALNGHSIDELASIASDFTGEMGVFESTFAHYQEEAEAFLIMRCDETAPDVAREIGSLRENMVASKQRLDNLLEAFRARVVAESENF
ncbi:hypothetical protein FWC63_01695 [Candidatus Saccharibacteria bacterium]|nr:hypothetical protein [Candidatus Saccharibacteria bacterium]